MNSKLLAIRAIKRMVDVISEQFAELGYKDPDLVDGTLAVKNLSRALVTYIEKGA